MTGNELRLRIRRHLRDVETATEQGEFWSDEELLNVVNHVQHHIVDKAIESKVQDVLYNLMAYGDFPAAQFGNHQLPTDYVHYASAQAEQAGQYYPCSIYLGGRVILFNNTRNAKCTIFNDELNFLYDGSGVAGRLYYYRKPDDITFNDNELNTFGDEIYRNLIYLASTVLLGMKETQTQREFKTKQRELREWLFGTDYLPSYLISEDRHLTRLPRNDRAANNRDGEDAPRR